MTNAENAVTRKTIDVSKLPSTLFDYHAPIWWGNLWEAVALFCLP